MGLNILYLFHKYKDGDGASKALDFVIRIDKDICDDYLVVCKRKQTTKEINIVEESELSVIKGFLAKSNLIIHYVRSAQSNILKHVLDLAGNDIPVITTVVQSPSFKRLLLSPYELKNTNFFVFIDKTSYNSRIISFIPETHRTYIYLIQNFGGGYIKRTENVYLQENTGGIVYGRGSTLNKCPQDMFEVFDRINTEKKVFRIVGIPDDGNWVRKEAAKRSNVEVYPQLSSDEWFEMCKTFDVFLYELPKNGYASIDSTLGLAMCMRKPVVYMGCDAPKERIVHGISGFIADSVSEMAQYATALGKDYALRKKIGENGRLGVIQMEEKNNVVDRYHLAYKYAFASKRIKAIPLSYRLKYLFYCHKDIIRNRINKY